jgi:predicted nucleic acid-binding protein
MIVLDTDVLIDLADQRDPAFSFVSALRSGGEILGTTSINAAEILRGVAPQGPAARRVARVIAALHEVPFGPAASRRFGVIMHAADRAGTSLSLGDGLVAAAALEAGGRLVTRNKRDFAKVAGLEVLVPK